MKITSLGHVSAALIAMSASVLGQVHVVTESTKLLPDDLSTDDHHGWAVASEGEWLVATSPFDDDGGSSAGAAYVYARRGTSWQLTQKLLASDADGADNFGWSLALHDGRIAVGAVNAAGAGTFSGAVYTFVYDGTSWSEEDKFFPADGHNADKFGSAIALEGDRILVGAPSDDDQGAASGTAYVFRRGGPSWTLEQKLTAAGGQAGDRFGGSSALDGTTAVVGASEAAHVFVRSGVLWTEVDVLHSPVAAAGTSFGASLDIEDDLLLISQPFTPPGTASGRAHIFLRTAGTWAHAQTLKAADADDNDQFGWNVTVDRGRLLIGARYNDAAYVYEESLGTFEEVARLVPLISEGGIFGNSSTLTGRQAVVANRLDPEGAFQGGAVFVYELPFAPLGTGFCYGDELGASCPCANETAAGAGSGCTTSAGEGGMLYAGGSASVSADDLHLRAQNLLGAVGLLIAGPTQVNGGSGRPFNDGLRCVSGAVVRLGTRPTHFPLWGPGLAGQVGLAAGETWYFQVYFRDNNGPCAQQANSTNAVALTFTP